MKKLPEFFRPTGLLSDKSLHPKLLLGPSLVRCNELESFYSYQLLLTQQAFPIYYLAGQQHTSDIG